jgi:glutathione S-transferase
MDLYFAPLACSMATRISLYEAGGDANFIQVDGKAKRAADGTDFYTINPLGQVPVLRTDDGALLTENPAILLYVAEQFPESGLAPSGPGRYWLQQWLNFVATEMHKVIFAPLLDRASPDGAKSYAQDKSGRRLTLLDEHLVEREFLLDQFTVADAYLFTTLNWARLTGVLDLTRWPHTQAYTYRLLERPSIARALDEEMALFQAERARQAAA